MAVPVTVEPRVTARVGFCLWYLLRVCSSWPRLPLPTGLAPLPSNSVSGFVLFSWEVGLNENVIPNPQAEPEGSSQVLVCVEGETKAQGGEEPGWFPGPGHLSAQLQAQPAGFALGPPSRPQLGHFPTARPGPVTFLPRALGVLVCDSENVTRSSWACCRDTSAASFPHPGALEGMAGFSASPTFVLGFMQASHHGVARRSLGIIVKSVGFVVVVVVVDRGNPLTSFLAGKKKKKKIPPGKSWYFRKV